MTYEIRAATFDGDMLEVAWGFETAEEAEEYLEEMDMAGYDRAWIVRSSEGWDEPSDNFLSDSEADADVLRMVGWGTDEDYGSFDGEDF